MANTLSKTDSKALNKAITGISFTPWFFRTVTLFYFKGALHKLHLILQRGTKDHNDELQTADIILNNDGKYGLCPRQT
ncbi:hypothetical protein [Agarilytica rhodophyticola]|uniref:hypothetical protein n=1 Tax=Agarilytica rhodophyticola TaxID=1737490 RepID=UPI00156D97C6|nr:hypothetical protein [Agarilytica rhodophyticola]